MLYVTYVRHAHDQHSEEPGTIAGRADHFALTSKGELQAALLGDFFNSHGLTFTEVHSSTSRRAIQTTEIICHCLKYPFERVLQSERLKEANQGEWTNARRSQKYTRDVLALINASKGEFRPPGGESQNDVEKRVVWKTKETFEKIPDLDTRILVITHSMTMKCLYRNITDCVPPGEAYKLTIHNTAMARFTYNGAWKCIEWNATPHLPPPLVTG